MLCCRGEHGPKKQGVVYGNVEMKGVAMCVVDQSETGKASCCHVEAPRHDVSSRHLPHPQR